MEIYHCLQRLGVPPPEAVLMDFEQANLSTLQHVWPQTKPILCEVSGGSASGGRLRSEIIFLSFRLSTDSSLTRPETSQIFGTS